MRLHVNRRELVMFVSAATVWPLQAAAPSSQKMLPASDSYQPARRPISTTFRMSKHFERGLSRTAWLRVETLYWMSYRLLTNLNMIKL
jgi:hypothetical protein